MLASTPATAGVTTVPAVKTTVPVATSLPAGRTASPSVGAVRTRTRAPSSRRSVSSTITTASAPGGTGAPVMMRIASPGPRAVGRCGRAGRHLGDHVQVDGRRRDVAGAHGVAVDRAVGERRHVLRRRDVGPQHQAERVGAGHRDRCQRWAGLEHDPLRLDEWDHRFTVRRARSAPVLGRRAPRALGTRRRRRRRRRIVHARVGERGLDGERTGRPRGRPLRDPRGADLARPPVHALPRPRPTRPVAGDRCPASVGRGQRQLPPRARRLRRRRALVHAVPGHRADPAARSRRGRGGRPAGGVDRRRDARRRGGARALRASRAEIVAAHPPRRRLGARVQRRRARAGARRARPFPARA